MEKENYNINFESREK